MGTLNIEQVIIVTLIFFIVFKEVQNHFVIKDLMNRLMSKSYTNYQTHEKKKSGEVPRGQALTDEQMALWEKNHDTQLSVINQEIDDRLAEVKAHPEKVGAY